MIAHRFLGPATIGLGTGNAINGFYFAGHRRPIIGFIVLAIVIWVAIAALVLLKQRRKNRTGVMNTPAAMNFREGQQPPSNFGGMPPGYSARPGEIGIPLQTYQPKAAEQPHYR
jgi:hypothetical protein